MRNAKRSIGAMVGCAVLLAASCVLAQDWPQWRGTNRDGKVTGFTAPQTWPKELAQKWKTTVGLGDATPALVGQQLYVFVRQGDDEVAVCLGMADGKELWQNKYVAEAVGGPAARHAGPRSSPTVVDGKVVTLGVGGVLSCLDAATGKLVWRNTEFKAVPTFFVAMSPIVADGMCVAYLGAKDNAALIAFDLATGGIKWKWTGDAPAYGSPVLLTVGGVKQIVTPAEKNMVSVALADGKLLWEVPTPTERMFFNSATPIVDEQTVILTGQGKGTKAVRIEKQGNGFAAKELWNNEELGTGFNTPVLAGGLLFGYSKQGNFFCLDAQTGKTAWNNAPAQAASGRRQNFCGIVDAGPVLFGLPSDGELVVFKPNAKQYEELARYKVSETPTYAHPVISGKRIFIKDQDAVTLWSIE
jgi:outer membrane protein assembly factor BamB